MAKNIRYPGIYIENLSVLPASVVPVETAVPAFIGYTENDTWNGSLLVNKPRRISSITEYLQIFGSAHQTQYTNTINASDGIIIRYDGNGTFIPDGPIIDPFDSLLFRMYYCLQMYFANGGGPCYIVSCGSYTNADFTNPKAMENALEALNDTDEPTIILFTDAPSLSEPDFYHLYKLALAQSAKLMDRVVIADVYIDLSTPTRLADFKARKMGMNYGKGGGSLIENFRSGIGNNNQSYGAAYFPWLQTNLSWHVDESKIPVCCHHAPLDTVRVLRKFPAPGETKLENQNESLYHVNYPLYQIVRKQMDRFRVILPPSSAIAGIYSMVDNTRGVWKAPANVSLNSVIDVMVKIDEHMQTGMNVDSSGKSINAIRQFPGKGNLVWGARTLAGNDPEWRYINVRRYYNMVSESLTKAINSFVFEPNDANTWLRVKSMSENLLMTQWTSGALAGTKPEEAFFVKVGLGYTMTSADIAAGKMIIELGLSVLKPAEFIMIRIIQNMGNG